MCFSAGASFGAGALLGVAGIVTIAKAKTKSQKPFAILPLIFCMQQLSEGMLWLSINDPGLAGWQPFFTYAFLAFAMVIWPVWIPFSIGMLEKNKKRKKILIVLVATGIVAAFGVLAILLLFPVRAVPHHHLHYQFGFSPLAKNLVWIFSLLYFIATIIPPFISGIKRMKWLGIGFFLSYLVAIIFYNGFVVSVWCYFAAFLSFLVIWILHELRRESN